MGFMSAYKHLDRLCRDINGIGVTGYIEDMERNHIGAFRVSGWDNDYKQLKHYRWIRNQIAHENYADEDTLCEPKDAEWLDEFYDRIIKQTDPLALARKALSPHRPHIPTKDQPYFYTNVVSEQHKSYHHCDRSPVRKNAGWGRWLVIAIIMIINFR